MLPFAYYVFKVIICSGILYGYYLIALRNKIFHRWNRFYLLAIVIISLAAPLIKINIWHTAEQTPSQTIQILQIVNSGDELVYNYATKNNSSYKPVTKNDSDLVKNFVYYHITKQAVSPYGKPVVFMETMLQNTGGINNFYVVNSSASPPGLSISNKPSTVPGRKTANLVMNQSHYFANRSFVHLIDNYFSYLN